MEDYCQIHNDQELVKGCKNCQKTFCFMCAFTGLGNELSKNEVKHEFIRIKDFKIMFPDLGNEKIVVNCEEQKSLIQKNKLLPLKSMKEIKEIRLKKEVEMLNHIKMIRIRAMQDCITIKKEFFKLNQFISHKLIEAGVRLSQFNKYHNKLSKLEGKSISKKEWENTKIKLENLIKKDFHKLNSQSKLEEDLILILREGEINGLGLTCNIGQIKVENGNDALDNNPIFNVNPSLLLKGNYLSQIEEWIKKYLKETHVKSLSFYFQNFKKRFVMKGKVSTNELKIYLQFSNYIKDLQENESYRHLLVKYNVQFETLNLFQKLLLNHSERKANNKYPDYYFLRGKLGSFLLNTINSPFLFHLEFKNPDSIIHIKNLKTNDIHKINFYPRSNGYRAECDQFMGYIFCLGGYNDGLLNTCWGIELSKLPLIKKVESLMKVARSSGGTVSTINNLYIIGGFIDKSISNCEKYDMKSNQWTEISPLNNADSGITIFYNSPFEIYTFGGYYKDIYEKLNIDPSISNPKWEILQVSNTSKRCNGIAYLISKSEVLLFGGENAPTEFVVYDFVNRKCTNQGKQFVANQRFNTSKYRLYNNLVHIVSYEDKNIYKIDVKNMTFVKSAIDF